MADEPLPDLKSLAVLAVDDHAINREFLAAALTPLCSRLELAANGHEAIEQCREHRFDVVLMDLHMPDMDGVTAWQRIREHSSGDPRIIALTADWRDQERRRLKEAGFHGFLGKPARLDALTRTIAQVAAGREEFTWTGRQDDDPTRLLDNERALAAANHNHALVARLRGLLAEDLQRRLPELEQHLAAGRWAPAAAILHQWSGACGYAGANRLEQACRSLQHSLETDLDSSPGTLYVHLLTLAECTRQAIQLDFEQPAADPQ